jgi:hypothetical protein
MQRDMKGSIASGPVHTEILVLSIIFALLYYTVTPQNFHYIFLTPNQKSCRLFQSQTALTLILVCRISQDHNKCGSLQREGSQFLKISWTLYSIASIVIVLRLYAQAKFIRQLGWGDALMVISLVSSNPLIAGKNV